MPSDIGTLNEGPLHAAIKQWYARPGDEIEVPIDGRTIDLVRGDLLIEIQTGGFAPLRAKLTQLLPRHRVRLVHPVPLRKWIVRTHNGGAALSRRKSPRVGRIEHAFERLTGLAKLLDDPNFSFEVLLTHQDEIRRHQPGRAWRRKGWLVTERRLVEVISRHSFVGPADYRSLIPPTAPARFTNAQLAEELKIPVRLAGQLTYCLRAAAAIEPCAKRGNAIVYRLR